MSNVGSLPGQFGPVLTVVDPITQQAVKAQANQLVKKNSAPWGNVMPVSHGARAVIGKLIWSSNLREVPQTEPASAGNTQPPRYEVDLAVSFGLAGAAPDKRAGSQLIHLWAQQILCYDIDDSTLTEQFHGMTVRFHPGLFDALPDATVQADKGPLTPAWRNQIYVVIEKFPLWMVGLTDGLPDFVAEIFDSTSSGAVITPYTMLSPAVTHPGGGGTGFPSQTPFLRDDAKGVGYAFIRLNDGTEQLGTYDFGTFAETSRVTIPGHGTTYTSLQADVLCVHDKDHGFALLNSGISTNSAPLCLVNLATGAIISSIGKSSSNFVSDIGNSDPTLCELVSKSIGDVFKTQYLGGTWYGFVLGAFWDQVCLLSYPASGSRMHFSAKTNLGGSIGFGGTENMKDMVAYPIVGRADLKSKVSVPAGLAAGSGGTIGNMQNQDAFAFIAHGSKVSLMRIGTVFNGNGFISDVDFNIQEIVDVLSFPSGTVLSLFIDQSDWNLVVFWSANDTANITNMTKVKITCKQTFTDQGWRPFLDQSTIMYTVTLPEGYFATELRFVTREAVPSTSFGYQSGTGKFIEMDLSTGSVLHTTPVAGSPTNGYSYNGKRGQLEYIKHESDIVQHIKVRSTNAEKIPLADVLAQFLVTAGYTADQFTIDAGIADTVYGAMVDTTTDLWSMMKNISLVFDFAYFISGDKVKFVRPATLATPPAFSVNLSNLFAPNSNPFEALTTTFAAPYELPGNSGVTYIDFNQHYVANTQTFRRTNFPVQVADLHNDTTVPIPIVMVSSEALRRSGTTTFSQFAMGEIQAFKLPPAFMQLEPTDIINVTTHEFVYNVLVGEIVYDTDWTISVTGSNRDTRASDAFRVGPDGEWIDPGTSPFITVDPTPPARPLSLSESDAVLFDVPLLKVSDVVANAYISLYAGAAAKAKAGFVGASVSTQVDTDPWNNLFHSEQSVPLGQSTAALPTTLFPFQTDTTTVLTVAIRNFDPSLLVTLATEEEFLAGKNAMLIGAEGRWELLYFRDVTVVGTMVQISHLLRGCRGTELHCNDHLVTDAVYLVNLNGARQGLLAQGTSYLDAAAPFRVRARGDNFVGDAQTAQITIEGNSLKPWAPCGEKASLSGSDLVLTWQRRDRLATNVWITNPPQMSEQAEVYDLEIMSGSTIVRTVAGLTSPTYTYLAADQTTDGFSPPLASLKVRVYQVSANMGRGFRHETTITVGAD